METLPRFRPDLAVFEHTDDDGAKLVVLKDPITERFFRLTPLEHQFLKAFDGTRTLDQAAEACRASGRYVAPADGRRVLIKAAGMGLMLATSFGTALQQRAQKDRIEEAHRHHRLASMYFFFMPLVNPDRFLERTLWIWRMIVHRGLAVVMAVLVPGALYSMLSSGSRWAHEYLFFFSWQGVFFLWTALTVLKLIHEMAHAYVAKDYGLRVPRMGVAFLVFVPYLYCDTTHVWQLPTRHQRLAVAAAGVVAEMAICVLAVYCWTFTRPGILNSVAFHLVAVSLVTTMLVNANPLIKRDGYFVLTDLLDMPNLAGKSSAHIKYLWLNRVLGIETVEAVPSEPFERLIFVVYGVLAFLYRIFIYASIVGIVYKKFDRTLGLILALLAIVLFMIQPVVEGAASLGRSRGHIRPRPVGTAVALSIAALAAALLFIPLKTRSVYPCYVASARVQALTLPVQTSVAKVHVRQGSTVRAGEVLIALDTHELELDLDKKSLERDELKQEEQIALLDKEERAHAATKHLEFEQMETQVARIRQKLDAAHAGVTAQFDGVVTRLAESVQPGLRPGEGVILGEILSTADVVIHALVPGRDRHSLSPGQPVEVWLPIGQGVQVDASIVQLRPYTETDLRDSPLSSAMGGELATEPRDAEHTQTPLEDLYKCTARCAGPIRGPSGEPLPGPLFGLTGRLIQARAPRSVAQRILDAVFSTYNRESIAQ